jgi:hypothetical protein
MWSVSFRAKSRVCSNPDVKLLNARSEMKCAHFKLKITDSNVLLTLNI